MGVKLPLILRLNPCERIEGQKKLSNEEFSVEETAGLCGLKQRRLHTLRTKEEPEKSGSGVEPFTGVLLRLHLQLM